VSPFSVVESPRGSHRHPAASVVSSQLPSFGSAGECEPVFDPVAVWGAPQWDLLRRHLVSCCGQNPPCAYRVGWDLCPSPSPRASDGRIIPVLPRPLGRPMPIFEGEQPLAQTNRRVSTQLATTGSALWIRGSALRVGQWEPSKGFGVDGWPSSANWSQVIATAPPAEGNARRSLSETDQNTRLGPRGDRRSRVPEA